MITFSPQDQQQQIVVKIININLFIYSALM